MVGIMFPQPSIEPNRYPRPDSDEDVLFPRIDIPGEGQSTPTSGALISLPQNGGTAQTVNELIRQQDSVGGERSEALFGNVRARGENGELLPSGSNYLEFVDGNSVPEGRDRGFRAND